MPLYDIPNITSGGTATGLDDFIVLTIAEINVFTPMFLIFVFGVVWVGGMTSQKRRTGASDMALWTTMASVSTFMVSLPLTLLGGLIDITTFSIVVAVTLMSGIWLFLDKNRREA